MTTLQLTVFRRIPNFGQKKVALRRFSTCYLLTVQTEKWFKPCLIKMKIYPSALSRFVQLPGPKQSLQSETSTLEIPSGSPVFAVGRLNVQAKNKTQGINCQTIHLSHELTLIFV